MKRLRGKLTYSNVASTLCLFLLLGGGTAFAATELAKNSVGTKQLKNKAVTPAKLSKAAKATLTGPRGATGPAGPQGPKGDRGEKGETGEAGPFPSTLPSGKSVYGAFEILGTATATGQFFGAQISYTYLIPGQTAVYVKEGTTSTTCTGSYENPTAPPGFTCIYEHSSQNAQTGRGTNYPSQSGGLGLQASSVSTGLVQVYGTWAATAK